MDTEPRTLYASTGEHTSDRVFRRSGPSGPDDDDSDTCRTASDVDEVSRQIARYQRTGDAAALCSVMAEFDWLAVSCARRMQRRGEMIDDLEQVAREGLLGAVQRFDTTRGVPFKTFAWATVFGVLRHHYRSRWQVRVPRGLQELHLAVMRAIDELTAVHGRAPTVDDLAVHTSADREDIILALDIGHAYRAESVNHPPLDRSDGGTQERVLGESDRGLEGVADRVDLRRLLTSLPEVQRTVLVMSFFEGRTQSEIGAHLGVSQVHVSRLMRAALVGLRQRAVTG
jgi:RNA polymerase sigma-B factor